MLKRVEPFYATTARWADIQGSCLGNGSVNRFPWQRILMQQKNGVVYVARADTL
jgi:hypothetical protein